MKESLRREIVVVLVGIGMLVGVFSGCMEETVKSNNAPVADFEWSPETVVVNETVQFTSTSSDADGDSLTYTWDFGDGSALSSEKDPTHIYTKVGLYNVTLKVSDGTDNDTITKTVNVYNAATVEAGEDQTIPNGWTVQLDGTVGGGSGDIDVLWTPSSLVDDATIEDPTTVPLGATQIFTLTATDANSGCTNKDSTTVMVTGGPLSVTTTASPMVICEGEIVHLSANPSGGSGENTYTWTSSPLGFTADIKEPSDFPITTTTYKVEVFDGQTTVSSEVTVQVKPKPIANAGIDKSITVGTSTTITGASGSAGSGNYNYSWEPSALLENASVLSPQTVVLNEEAEFTFVVKDENGCNSEPDKVWIFTGGDGLSVTPTASPSVICLNETTTLHANAFGGGENYSYQWHNESGWSSTAESPTVSPTETTVNPTHTYNNLTQFMKRIRTIDKITNQTLFLLIMILAF